VMRVNKKVFLLWGGIEVVEDRIAKSGTILSFRCQP